MKYPEIEEDRRKMTAKSFSLAAKKRWKECEERKEEFLSAKWLSNHFDFSESPRYGLDTELHVCLLFFTFHGGFA